MNFSDDDIDALSEIVNVGVGRAAGSLSQLIGSRIDLCVPEIKLVDRDKIGSHAESGMSVIQGFDGAISGNALLIFPNASGRKLAALLVGTDEADQLPEFEISGILSEVGNIVLNGVLGSLANAVKVELDYKVPDFYANESFSGLMDKGNHQSSMLGGPVLVADARFSVESADISGSVVLAFRLGSLESLLQQLQKLYV